MSIMVANALFDLEAALRQAQLWESTAPSPQLLRSQEPFCVDTLTLPQWLQFVFLPRMRALIEHQQALPEDCAIAPMAEEYFRGSDLMVSDVISILGRIDTLLSGGEDSSTC